MTDTEDDLGKEAKKPWSERIGSALGVAIVCLLIFGGSAAGVITWWVKAHAHHDATFSTTLTQTVTYDEVDAAGNRTGGPSITEPAGAPVTLVCALTRGGTTFGYYARPDGSKLLDVGADQLLETPTAALTSCDRWKSKRGQYTLYFIHVGG